MRILIPADRQQEEDLILGRIRRGEPIEHFETVRVTKDGRLIDISLTVSPVRDGAGRHHRGLEDCPGHHRPQARSR